jgi:predicted Na+-dependent transporter
VSRLGRESLANYRELGLVVLAAIIGLTVQPPLAWMTRHQGINILLALLVFASAITIEPRTLRRLPQLWPVVALALVLGITVLPAVAWVSGFLVHAGPLREGVLTIGLAPCEIASIAMTAAAGGEVALTGGILIGSTVCTVALSGPILGLEVSHVAVHPANIITNLVLVVVLPLLVALALRIRLPLPASLEGAATGTSAVAVAGLVALIASQVHFALAYLGVVAAIAVFMVATVGVGTVIATRSHREVGRSLLLTVSMRDFAIAAGLAAAAFGPKAAAPLGLYGIAVLAWGTGCAGFLRDRDAKADSVGPD